MKKLLFVFVFCLGTGCLIQAQVCIVGDQFFASQAQVDTFVTTYSGTCNSIDGNVTFFNTNITDVSGLSFITEITGDLTINRTLLTDLTGLDNLTTVSGNFLILRDNFSLMDVSGLQNLANFTGSLQVINNRVLPSLTGLNGITQLASLLIDNNLNFTNLGGLTNLTTCGTINLNNCFNLATKHANK